MAVIASQKTSQAGLNPTMAAASGGGDSFANSGNEWFRIIATSNQITVTFVAQGVCSHGVLHNVVVVVPIGNTREIGPFRDLARFNDANGRVQVTYDLVTGATVGVFTN